MFEEAIDFADKIKGFRGILSVVLFGSLARGEATRDSDIDIAIIYSEKDEKIIRKIGSMAPERFQLTHLTLEELKKEPTICGALSGEGILLYGHPVAIKTGDIELRPKMFLAYDTSKLDQNTRNKLHRALYGGTSSYFKEGKKKVKKYKGIIDTISVERVGRGVLLVDRKNYTEITKTLKSFKAKWKEIPVWTY